MLKPKQINLSDSDVELLGVGDAARSSEGYDLLNGKKVSGVYNLKGCKVVADLVLAQTYAADRFELRMRVGRDWFPIGEVSQSSDFIKQLQQDGKLVVCGSSPQEIEQARRKEEEEQQRVEEAKRHQLERQRIMRERTKLDAKRHGRAA